MRHPAFLNTDGQFTSLLQALLDNTSSVIYVKDVDFKYLLINRQFEQLFHVTREEILGKTDFDIFPHAMAEGFRANDLIVLDTTEPRQCDETALQDDGYHHYRSLKFPLQDQEGKTYAIAGVSTDITERHRAQREIASLQHRQHLILNSVGDGICGLDEEGRISFLNPAAEKMLQWSTEQLRGQCHSQILLNRKQMPWKAAIPAAHAIDGAGHQPLQIDVRMTTFRRQDGGALPVEYTVAPLFDRDNVVGAVVAFRDTTDRLKQMAIEQEIQTARRIQISLTPKQVPVIPGFDFAATSIPCSKACGDYYDFIEWHPGCLGIAVGDVSGHGLGAALEMVETRAILRTTMLTDESPVSCLKRLNEILTADLPDDMFVTLFLTSLNTVERTFSYAAAGHDAILVHRDGSFQHLDSTATVLGWNEEAEFSGHGPIQLNSGDVLLLATDGIAETVSPQRELFGRERMIDVIQSNLTRSANTILESLRSASDSFRGPERQRDDITAVVVKAV